MKLPIYKNKDVCIEYCRFSPSIYAWPTCEAFVTIIRYYYCTKTVSQISEMRFGYDKKKNFIKLILTYFKCKNPDLDLTFDGQVSCMTQLRDMGIFII